MESLIPKAKLQAVETALQTAFQTKTVESISLLNGGLSSALVYKIIVAGKPYVLRLVMQTDALNDPVRQYICMNAAATAGIAPPVRYASSELALSITDFIETIPLTGHFASPNDRLLELAKSLTP